MLRLRINEFTKNYSLFFLCVLTLLGSCNGEKAPNEIVLETKTHVFAIDKTNTTFRLEDKQGKVLLAPHDVSGFILAQQGSNELHSVKIEDYKMKDATSVEGKLCSSESLRANFSIKLERHFLYIQITPEDSETKLTMEVRTAPMSPAYGLGDHGGYEGKTNLFG